jgi:ABC-2 type transport system permease protein
MRMLGTLLPTSGRARGARRAERRAGRAALMRLAVESGVLFQRALREIPRVPTRIAFPVIGPVMQLVLLTAVLSRVTQLPGYPARSSVQFMTAGVLSLTVLAGSGGAGFQMVQDIDTGFFDKLRVAPISRAAIVLGLLLTDATRLAVQSLVVLLLALLLGAHIATGVLGLLGILGLAAVFGMAWSGISLNVALRTRNPEVTAAAGVLTFPLYFGSTAFMPHDLLPGWLQWFNIFNPINYLITADRALMSSHWDWHAIGGAVLTSLIVGAVTMPLATRAFRRAVSS